MRVDFSKVEIHLECGILTKVDFYNKNKFGQLNGQKTFGLRNFLAQKKAKRPQHFTLARRID